MNANCAKVPASRLITSYPIPPQESFSCSPYSTRIRKPGSSDITRYTYAVTSDKAAQKITLFKDIVRPDGKTTSTTTSQKLKSAPVKHITASSMPPKDSNIGDVVLVCSDGEVISLSGESLAAQWSASAKSTIQDAVAGGIDGLEVEHVTSGSVGDFTEGLFKNKPEVFNVMPKSLEAEPEILALVARSTSKKQSTRHLIVVAAMSSSASSPVSQNLAPLDIAPIASTTISTNESAVHQIDIHAAVLLQLQNGVLNVFDLSGAIPKVKSAFDVEGASTFTKLSRPFVLSSSLESMNLFNYQYRSAHANVTLDLSELPSESQSARSCKLISYIRSQHLVVALVDNVLVSIHVEPPTHHGKRHKDGMLIDSIGRGTASEGFPKRVKREESIEFAQKVPGTMTESYLEEFRAQTQAADEMLAKNQEAQWDELLREKFHMEARKLKKSAKVNGHDSASHQEMPEWQWLQDAASYPAVDRRWVVYAVSQVFSAQLTKSEIPRPELRLLLPDSYVTTYLVVAGHMTLSNIRSAFVEELSSADDATLAADVIRAITEAEPSMTLLLNYLQSTKLGEVELVFAIRALMQSMDLIPDTKRLNSTKLLANEAHESSDNYEMDLDDLERDIAVTEHYLGDDSSSRSRGLTLAFTKLWRQPTTATVQALRRTLRTEEILSFIYLLRMELVRGAWTSLYIDPTSFDSEGNEPPPDGVITLIADLLGRCLDAVGAGGWLFNDAMSWADKAEAGDFITALKLEVTAALEGLEEAVYLNGVVSETVRFGYAAQKSGVARASWNPNKPVPMQLEGQESRALPLGLKNKMMPTKEKVVSGGEVVQRSLRETGHLISQKVEPYSLEKLAI